MDDSLLYLSLSHESIPQIALHLRNVGLYLKSLSVIRDRFAKLPPLHQRTGKVVLGTVIVVGNINGMSPQCFAISPICGLEIAARYQCSCYDQGGNGQYFAFVL